MTTYHCQYWAHLLTLKGAGGSIENLIRSISNARVDLNPHQLDAAQFALRSPLSKGAVLADEVGLGKTIDYDDHSKLLYKLSGQLIDKLRTYLTNDEDIRNVLLYRNATGLGATGETTRCEFKSTLRLNLHTKERDKKMEHSCLKTIAAFLNSHGGYLVVGVNDDGEALGLENDGFPNEDKMNLHLVNLLKQRLGAENLVHVEPRFESFSEKRVLVVKCKPSNLPVFLKDGNTEQFYIRTGAATTELKPSEVQSYVEQRF